MVSKDFYSTGEVSAILNISRATVSRKFDAGIFYGRKNPITGERLISHESLTAFMRKYNLSTEKLGERPVKKVLIGSNDADLKNMIGSTLSKEKHLSIYKTDSGYDALIQTSVLQPDLFIIDNDLTDINCADALDSLARQDIKNSMKVVCFLRTNDPEKMKTIKADTFLTKDSMDKASLQHTILSMLDIETADIEKSQAFIHNRTWQRAPIHLPAGVEVFLPKAPEIHEQGSTQIENISLGGAYLSNIQLEKGSIPFGNFRIKLQVNQEPLTDFHAECKVIRLRANGTVNAGVEFTDITERDRAKISSLIS